MGERRGVEAGAPSCGTLPIVMKVDGTTGLVFGKWMDGLQVTPPLTALASGPRLWPKRFANLNSSP